MGITRNDCRLLFHARSLGVQFDDTCTLGRLRMYADRQDVLDCLEKYPVPGLRSIGEFRITDGYTEPLFTILGARNLETLDFSDYEKATRIHDLNTPVPERWHNSFSCVLDSGTLEHVFNFPVAIRNCMQMVRTGGHYIGISPANNQMGHGFYQFSPELYYRVFSPANGFQMVKMLVAVDINKRTDWYEVSDPEKVQSRIMVVNSIPLSLMFIAKKVSDADVFASFPQQSDYVTVWNTAESRKPGADAPKGGVGPMLRKMVPYRIKVFGRKWYDAVFHPRKQAPGLGEIDSRHFRKVSI